MVSTISFVQFHGVVLTKIVFEMSAPNRDNDMNTVIGKREEDLT